MSQKFQKNVIIMKRQKGQLSHLLYYEQVHVEANEAFRVLKNKQSVSYTIQLTPEGLVALPYIEGIGVFPWYEEKYIFSDTGELFDKLCDLELPKPILDWFTRRL